MNTSNNADNVVTNPRGGANGRRRGHRTGLSLVEALISLAITAMLLVSVSMAFTSSTQVVQANDEFFRATQAARVGLNQMLTEVRRATVIQGSPNAYSISMLTDDAEDRTYLYDPDAKKLYLYLGDVADNVRYTLCNNVKSATFSVDSVVKNNASHVVRVAVTMDVEYGSNHIQLSGSAAPRREVSYD
jgi:type II secretory pathway pseudopilin PulG